MDPLAALLQGPRAQSTFVLRSSLDPPWCLRIEDGAPLTIAAVVRGSAWVKSDDGVGHPVLLESGDVLVSRGPTPYAISDAIDRSENPDAAKAAKHKKKKSGQVVAGGSVGSLGDGYAANQSQDLGAAC